MYVILLRGSEWVLFCSNERDRMAKCEQWTKKLSIEHQFWKWSSSSYVHVTSLLILYDIVETGEYYYYFYYRKTSKTCSNYHSVIHFYLFQKYIFIILFLSFTFSTYFSAGCFQNFLDPHQNTPLDWIVIWKTKNDS